MCAELDTVCFCGTAVGKLRMIRLSLVGEGEGEEEEEEEEEEVVVNSCVLRVECATK